MKSLLGIGLILLVVAILEGGTEKSKKDRVFVGSIQVPPEKRDEVVKMLKEKGLEGVQIPPDSAPETIIYVGTKADYEAAEDVTNRLLFPQYYDPKYKRNLPSIKLPPQKKIIPEKPVLLDWLELSPWQIG